MPALLDLQRRFCAAILTGAPPPDIAPGTIGVAARLGIYRNNVIGNLTGSLRLTFPAVERLAGEDFFTAAGARFIAEALPTNPDLYEYGAGFSAFLANLQTAHSFAFLADVARLEWAVNKALHAPLAPPLDPAALRAIRPKRQPDLRFIPHPSLSLLALAHPAHAIWEAALAEDPDDRAARLAAIDPAAGTEMLAVSHAAGVLEIAHLSPALYRLAHAMTGQIPLAEALAVVPPAEAPSLLAGLLANGFFADVRLPEHGEALRNE